MQQQLMMKLEKIWFATRSKQALNKIVQKCIIKYYYAWVTIKRTELAVYIIFYYFLFLVFVSISDFSL